MRTLLALILAGCSLLASAPAHAYQEATACIAVLEAANTDDEYYFPWSPKGSWEITEVYWSPATAVAADTTDVVAMTVAVNAGTASTSWTTIASTTTDSDITGYAAYVIGTSLDLTVTPATISQGYSIRVENTNGGSGKAWDGSICVTAIKRG